MLPSGVYFSDPGDSSEPVEICSQGTTFYVCWSNKFRGCCSTDPCALSSCPDFPISWKDPKNGDESGDEDGISTNSQPKSQEATPTPTSDDQSLPTEFVTSPLPASTTMTDSGITHTIPNNSIITITRHTTITTGRSSSTTSDSVDIASTASSTPITTSTTVVFDEKQTASPTDGNVTANPSGAASARPLPTGAIVGIAIGGVVLIAIAVAMIVILARRKKRRESETDAVFPQANDRDEVVEEKHFPQNVSTHTTGTQGSSDPFAPFGGRADKLEDPYRPVAGAFEMDGTSCAPVELPAASASSPDTTTPKTSRLEPVQEITPTDPRARLTSVPEDGKPVYVNQWNQFKNLG